MWAFVEALLAAPGFSVSLPTRLLSVLGEVIAEIPDLAGNLLHDATTACLMREHGIRTIMMRDTGFHRFRFLMPEDPMA